MVFTKMRRRMVLLLSIGGLINHVDRSALSIAVPSVARDLHLSRSLPISLKV